MRKRTKKLIVATALVAWAYTTMIAVHAVFIQTSALRVDPLDQHTPLSEPFDIQPAAGILVVQPNEMPQKIQVTADSSVLFN
jgi:hypothetical protein